jgi:hypothetical protein
LRFPRDFLRDIVDGGAGRNSKKAGFAGQVAGIATALAGLLALLDVAGKTLDRIVGAPAVIIQLALAFIAIGGCAYIISARLASSDERKQSYRFGILLRHGAKIFLVVLLVFVVPRTVNATREHYERLPNVFGGTLVDVHTGEPIANATVRVTVDGEGDVGGATWPSDSGGFYIIQLARAFPRRNVILTMYSERCRSQTLALTRSAEVRDPPTSSVHARHGLTMKMFRHVVDCQGREK